MRLTWNFSREASRLFLDSNAVDFFFFFFLVDLWCLVGEKVWEIEIVFIYLFCDYFLIGWLWESVVNLVGKKVEESEVFFFLGGYLVDFLLINKICLVISHRYLYKFISYIFGTWWNVINEPKMVMLHYNNVIQWI